MSELLKINVNGHVEKKNNLSYLSWAWAWAEVLKLDPQATHVVHEFNGLPVCFLPDTSAMVKVSVTIKGDTKTCHLPVMNHRNQAIKNPDAFAINTAIMRCLTKAISLHGLGLYIYAGEDLPEQEKEAGNDPEPRDDVAPKISSQISATRIAFEGLKPDWQAWVTDWARDVQNTFEQASPAAAQALIEETMQKEDLDGTFHAALYHKLDSKTRSGLDKLTKGERKAA